MNFGCHFGSVGAGRYPRQLKFVINHKLKLKEQKYKSIPKVSNLDSYSIKKKKTSVHKTIILWWIPSVKIIYYYTGRWWERESDTQK